MGASVSTVIGKDTQESLNKVYNTCSSASGENVVTLKNFTFEPPRWCSNSDFNIDQAAQAKSSCVISTLQDTAFNTISKLDAKAKAELGIAVATTDSEIKNKINQAINNNCGHLSTVAYNDTDLDKAVVKSCNLTIAQDASAQTMCQIQNAQDIISKVTQVEKATSTGGSLAGMLFGSIGGKIVIAVLAVSIISSIVYLLTKGGKHGHKHKHKDMDNDNFYIDEDVQKGGFTDFMSDLNDPEMFTTKMKNNKSWIILLIIVIFILILFFMGSRNTAKKGITLTNDDMQNLRNQIHTVQKMAGVQPKHEGAIISENRSDTSALSPSPSPYHTEDNYPKFGCTGPGCQPTNLVQDYWPDAQSHNRDLNYPELDDFYAPLL